MRMSPAILLAVYALAVARVTHLITHDRITEAPRRWLSVRLWARTIDDETAAARFAGIAGKHGPRAAARVVARDRFDAGGEPPLAVYLLTCAWCVSTYVGVAGALVWYFAGSSPWALIPAAALALSYVTGFLAGKEA
jgi:hypothetical protein